MLHNQTWAQRGQTGAFHNNYLAEFHRNLIRFRLQSGEIQLVAIFIDDLLLGVIYNFVYRGQIYNYQSGLNYKSNINKCKPGLLIHTLAIQHYADSGYLYYDLLAGDSQYKRTLATDGASLCWVVYRPKRLKFWIEHRLRLLKRHLRNPIIGPNYDD